MTRTPSFRLVLAPAPACARAASLLAGGLLTGGLLAGCIPAGNSTSDAGPSNAVAAPLRPSVNVMRTVFEDDFERAGQGRSAAAPSASASASPGASAAHGSGKPGPDAGALRAGVDAASPDAGADANAATANTATADGAAGEGPELGPDWTATSPVWHIENGRLCGAGARNHGVWLNRTLPVNARIEFDAVSYSTEGDLKAEAWGDGRSYATATSYTNASSYLAILGGWRNTLHVLARINEHGDDRKVIRVDPQSDDSREKPVNMGQVYRFKIERTDGHTVRWFVDGQEYLSFDDPAPLAGAGHDHFGFNNWNVKVCFDNVRVTPL